MSGIVLADDIVRPSGKSGTSAEDARALLVSQLKLMLRRAELGLRVGVSSVLRLASLVREIEGSDE